MAAARAAVPEERREGRPEGLHEIAFQGWRSQDAKPEDRQHQEVERRHGPAGEHGARHRALGINHLPDMTGGGFEGWCG